MNAIHKKSWMASLAVVAVLTVASLSLGGSAASGDASPERAAEKAATGESTDVVLYYFHGTRRCKTCRTIEEYAKKAIGEKFKDALREGALRWVVLNTDEAVNSHFVKDFDLYSSSLVVVEMNGDEVIRHDVLQDAWRLVRDEPRFIQYVQRSVHEYLQ